MRAALIILHADPARGGAERYTIDLSAALVERGHQVSLLASSFSGEAAAVAQVRLNGSGLTKHGRYTRFLDSLDAHLAKQRYDIVHAMLPVRRCDVYHPHAGTAAEMARPADALLRPRRRAMAAVERELLTRPDGPVVLCLSEYVKRSIRRYHELPDQKLATLFNAVDLGRFLPESEIDESEAVTALIIANDFERKGLYEAIEATARLKDQPIRLVVVGKQDPSAYRRLARELGAAVGFAGAAADPRPFYRSADFFVLPTKHDPCSLVVLEALAMGLPVISTRFNGACEIMTDGVHGYVIDDPSDVAALEDAMRRMLDPKRRAEMREACLALRPRLSFDHHVSRLLSIYREAAGTRSPARG